MIVVVKDGFLHIVDMNHVSLLININTVDHVFITDYTGGKIHGNVFGVDMEGKPYLHRDVEIINYDLLSMDIHPRKEVLDESAGTSTLD